MQIRALALLLLLAPMANSQTLTALAISPRGAAIQTSSTLQFTALCTYSDSTTDNCTKAGGATWSTSRASLYTVSSSGLVTVIADQGAGLSAASWITVQAGSLLDRAGVFEQHPGDTFYQYITPDYMYYKELYSGALLPLNVAVGAKVAIGSGFRVNDPAGGNGNPLQISCNWSSSDVTKATVNSIGDVTAVAPGSARITCGRQGNAVYGTSTTSGWLTPGNYIDLTIVNGGTSNQTWYVRPDGGTPYTNATDTPAGRCDGKHDAPDPGSGVNQPCAVSKLMDLWSDEVTYQKIQWMIAGGDTVIVRQKTGGYTNGLNQAYSLGYSPSNCAGDPSACRMPTIPSGTAARHTKILGGNYANCHADSAKTLLTADYLTYGLFNTTDSQYVDVACFEVTDKAACGGGGTWTHTCTADSDVGATGVFTSALSSEVNFTDLYLHGLTGQGFSGATGVDVNIDHVRIAGMVSAGLNLDDSPYGVSNISVSGGMNMTYSTVELSGCIEEYPVVHTYPVIECHDQNNGGYGDGLGTGSTSGVWVFDHDLFRYNIQDGLDLLHSGMTSLTVTNSTGYGNIGQQFKLGSGRTVKFQSNLVLGNCHRLSNQLGDMPAGAMDGAITYCRSGDTLVFGFDNAGTDDVDNNTIIGYSGSHFLILCDANHEGCPGVQATLRNNILLGYLDTGYQLQTANSFCDLGTSDCGQIPAYYPLNSALGGWAVRDHNVYENMRSCPGSLQTGESCPTADLLTNQPAAITSTTEAVFDNFNFTLTSGGAAKYAGLAVSGLTTDNVGNAYHVPPSMGALEFQTASPFTFTTGGSLVFSGGVRF